MTTLDTRMILTAQLQRIAPEIPIEIIDPDADLRDEFEIDSMDFLTLVTALGEKLSLPMPEIDYDQMRSFNSLLSYLDSELAKVK